MDAIIQSGQERLTAYVAEPPVAEARPPVLIVCHGYPSDALGSDAAARSHPELADRIANEGWRVIVFTFRGCGESTGNFSLGGWLDDLLAVVDQVPTFGPTRGVWLAGFGTGGGLCVSAAAAKYTGKFVCAGAANISGQAVAAPSSRLKPRQRPMHMTPAQGSRFRPAL